jgi:hypothetical protein
MIRSIREEAKSTELINSLSFPYSSSESNPSRDQTKDQGHAEGSRDARNPSIAVRAGLDLGSPGGSRRRLGRGRGSLGGLGSRRRQGSSLSDGLGTDLTGPDHDVLSVRRYTVDDQEQHGRSRGEEGGVGRHLGDVQRGSPGDRVNLVRGHELEESLTELNGMGRESTSNDVDLGRLDEGLVSSVQGHGPVVSTVAQNLGESLVTGSLLVEPLGVPPLDRVASGERGGLDVGVGVGTRDQQTSILEEDDGRVVESLLGGRSEVPVPSASLGLVGVVNPRSVDGDVGVRLSLAPTFSSVSGRSHLSTVTHPKGTVRKVDELTHGSTLGEEIIIGVSRVSRVGRDSYTRVIGGDYENKWIRTCEQREANDDPSIPPDNMRLGTHQQ